MTPPATAAAGARSGRTRRPAQARAQRHGGHAVRKGVAPRPPRRISGPVAGAAAVSAPLALRVGRTVAAMPDARIVDRLVRGRGWIALIGTLLIGVVAIQVSLLKLNSGIGRSVERAATLERVNGELQADIARLSSSERIQAAASKLGMVELPAGDVGYQTADPRRDASNALAALRAGRFAQPAAGSLPVAAAAPTLPAVGQTASTPPATPAQKVPAATSAPAIAPPQQAAAPATQTTGGVAGPSASGASAPTTQG